MIGEKATNAEIEQRVNDVIQLLIKGSSRRDIVRYGSETWKITGRQVEDYIARANAFLIEEAERSRKSSFGKSVAARTYILKEAMKNKDFMMADKQLDRLDDLYGNKAPTKNMNSNFNKDVTDLTDEQIDQEYAREYERLRELAASSDSPVQGIETRKDEETEEKERA